MLTTTRSLVAPVGAGLTGAVSLTLLNETLHRLLPESPRLDVLGYRALARLFRREGIEPPRGAPFRVLALVSELALNSLLFGVALAGRRKALLPRGMATGAAAGAIATVIAPRLGMTPQQGVHRGKRLGMFALYAAAGLCAGAFARYAGARLAPRRRFWLF